jgi:hypothetical protein
MRPIAWIAGLVGVAASSAAQMPALDPAELEAALASAQAAAVRPGDEALDCEALEGELVAVARDPALQAHVSRSGAIAQEKIDAMNGMAAAAAAQTALTIFSAVVPGGAWLGQAAAAAQLPAQQAQAAHNLEQSVQQARDLMTVMPQILRGQRVIELAQARECAWLSADESDE